MIALHEAWRSGLLHLRHWPKNILAGILVGLVALPLAMAFAIASGARPEQGIYTAIIAGIFVSIFGGSRVQIAGPTGAFIVILAGITREFGMEGLQIATLMAGLMLIIFSVFRLGSVIKFIPHPVIVGFTTGIAVIIFVSQWKDFFGLPALPAEHFHQTFWGMLKNLPRLHPATAALGLSSLALLVISPRLVPKVPGPLLVLLFATTFQMIFHPPGITTIGSAFGGIPRSLLSFHFPDLTIQKIILLTGPAFTIALLGSIESLLSAVVADGMAGTRHHSNQELFGQGLANVVTPLFGGFAATGAIARTATNVRNGGNSPVAGIIHALTLVLILLLFAPLVSHVPLCALAAILFVVAWNMSEARHFVQILRSAPVPDRMVLFTTFSLTVFVDLVTAVSIGVITAALFFIRRMASAVTVKSSTRRELKEELPGKILRRLPPGVAVYSIDGPFFFGAAETFSETLGKIHSHPDTLILRMGRVPFTDETGLHALEETILKFQSSGTRVIVTELNHLVREKLHKVGLTEKLGRKNIFKNLAEAVASL